MSIYIKNDTSFIPNMPLFGKKMKDKNTFQNA